MSNTNHNSKSLNNKILNLMTDAGIKPTGYSREFLLALTPQSFASLSTKNQYDCMSKLSYLALECEDSRFREKWLELYPIMRASQAEISKYVEFQLSREMRHA